MKNHLFDLATIWNPAAFVISNQHYLGVEGRMRERERCTWAQRLRIFLKLNAEFCYREYVEQELHVDAMDLVHVVEIQHDFQLYLPINYWQL